MCGIVGIYTQVQPSMGEHLGGYLAEMLAQLAERGPDSVGVAIYRDPVADPAPAS